MLKADQGNVQKYKDASADAAAGRPAEHPAGAWMNPHARFMSADIIQRDGAFVSRLFDNKDGMFYEQQDDRWMAVTLLANGSFHCYQLFGTMEHPHHLRPLPQESMSLLLW